MSWVLEGSYEVEGFTADQGLRQLSDFSFPSLFADAMKYRLYNKPNVQSLYDPKNLASTMPDLRNLPREYDITYRPAHPIPDPPLLGDEQLFHMFNHPAGQIYSVSGSEIHENECYNRLPKRRSILEYNPGRSGYPVGWGLEFVEGFNWSLFMNCELLIMIIDVAVVLLYCVFVSDGNKTSTAFTIGSWIFVLGHFAFAVILGISEKYRTWRF